MPTTEPGTRPHFRQLTLAILYDMKVAFAR